MQKLAELLRRLDPIQLGFIYESLLLNGQENPEDKGYSEVAEVFKDAIDANCGFDDYVKGQQALSRKLADYDGQAGYNSVG